MFTKPKYRSLWFPDSLWDLLALPSDLVFLTMVSSSLRTIICCATVITMCFPVLSFVQFDRRKRLEYRYDRFQRTSLFSPLCGLHSPPRDKVSKMFYHAYDAYLDHAFPYDELRPLTCDGVDTWGRWASLNLRRGHFWNRMYRWSSVFLARFPPEGTFSKIPALKFASWVFHRESSGVLGCFQGVCRRLTLRLLD